MDNNNFVNSATDGIVTGSSAVAGTVNVNYVAMEQDLQEMKTCIEAILDIVNSKPNVADHFRLNGQTLQPGVDKAYGGLEPIKESFTKLLKEVTEVHSLYAQRASKVQEILNSMSGYKAG